MADKTRTDVLVWVDLETTGLRAQDEIPLEIGLVITDPEGSIIDAYSSLIRCETYERDRDHVDPYVKEMHKKSGLWEDINEIKPEDHWMYEPTQVSIRCVDFLKDKGIEPGTVELCGSTVSFDRSFMAEHMPHLHSFFHYRNLDVSSLMVMCNKVNPELAEKFEKAHGTHRPIPDIEASLHTYRWMLDNFVHVG